MRSKVPWVTLHRPANVDDPTTLGRLLDALARLGQELPIVFPVHPRTRAALTRSGRVETTGLILSDPLGYLDFLKLLAHSRLVLTDSGGIQEETTVLGVPCLTLRENTERPATVEEGTNTLVGMDPTRILNAAFEILRTGSKYGRVPELWDGSAAKRVVDVLTA